MSGPGAPEEWVGPAGEELALLVLAQAEGLGPVTAKDLLARLGTARSVLAAGEAGLAAAGFHGRWVRSLFSPATRERARRDQAEAARLGLRIAGRTLPGYPERLQPLPDAPTVLFLRGDPELLRRPALAAVVGTRTPTPYGRRAAEELAGGLAAAGVVVVSGLARGIDSHAHHAALQAPGPTVAVLAGGLDRVYPPERISMAAAIAERGLLAAEMPPGTSLTPGLFPRRNRILSGLADLVVVVEADRRSGALITARWALDQGREVAAVPGPIHSPMSRGPHGLLRDGAALADSVAALLELLPGRPAAPPAQAAAAAGIEGAFLAALDRCGGDPEEAAVQAGLDPARALVLTAALELKGLLRQDPPGCYRPAPVRRDR